MQAKTFYGFEAILAQELKSLGAQSVKAGNRIVDFEGDLGFLYKANYSLRTALRILKPIYQFRAKTEDQLYNNLKKFHWNNIFDIDQTFSIDATVYSDYFTHSQYCALKMKDAIVDYFKEKSNNRPDVNKFNAQIPLNLHINQDQVTVSLDSSGESLHKRGYKTETGPAPINEVLAAGLLLLAGWDGKGNFLDPMCGSATMPIEAAMIACNIPPQLHRKHFAFENWKDFDKKLFLEIRDTRINRIKDFEGKIIGYDVDPKMISMAENNVIHADLDEYIILKNKDFFKTEKEHSPILLVFNPPYNERLQNDNETFYKKIGDTLKNNYPHTLAWFITSDLEAKKYVGLKPSKKVKLFNGKLECDFLQYEIYEGSKKAKFNKN